MVQLGKYGDRHTEPNQLRYNILPPTPENQHVNGKSPFLIGDTSLNGCFSIAMLVFGGYMKSFQATRKLSISTGERISYTQWYQ